MDPTRVQSCHTVDVNGQEEKPGARAKCKRYVGNNVINDVVGETVLNDVVGETVLNDIVVEASS